MTEARLFSRHSIGTRIAALFMLLILVITAAMTYVSISVLTNELLDSSTEYTEQLIRRVNAELDMYVEYMKDISDFIVDNGAVAAYLRAANEHRLTDAACREAQEQLAAAQKIRSEITAIALIPESGGALFGSEGASLNTYSNYQNADWYQAALQEPHEVQVSSSRVENLIAGQYNWVVSFSKAVLDRAGNMQGVLLIDLNYQIIDRLCADIQLGSRGYIYLIDQSGGILWHPQQDLIYAGLKEENVAEVLAAADGRTLSGKGRMRRLYVACIGGHRMDGGGRCLHAGAAAQSGQDLQDLSTHRGGGAHSCAGVRASALALHRRTHPPSDADDAARGGRRSARAQPGILPHGAWPAVRQL